MKKYASIGGYKELIRRVKDVTRYVGKAEDGSLIFDHNKPLPTLTFSATTKSHGTNAAIRFDVQDGTCHYQSRERELSLTSDNAGFMLWASQQAQGDIFANMINRYIDVYDGVESIVLFGEFCGSNIQKGVAISGLPKMFILFEVNICFVDGSRDYIPISETNLVVPDQHNQHQIYSMDQFGQWKFTIDFEHPELHQNDLVELCEKIEEECPIGKFFGVSGVGEGFVMTCQYQSEWLQAKIKGEKHSNSKVKKTASVDVEKFTKVNEFADNFCTEARLEQGIGYLREMQLPIEMSSLGAYIKWVNSDIVKEHMDSVVENQLDTKMIAQSVSKITRTFFINYVDAQP